MQGLKKKKSLYKTTEFSYICEVKVMGSKSKKKKLKVRWKDAALSV